MSQTLTPLTDDKPGLSDALFFDELEEETPTEAILLQGEGEDAMILTVSLATGEVVQDQLAPESTASVVEIADYLGPRLTSARGKLEGLKAERQVHLNKISDQFDDRIKQQERIVTWLENGAGFWEVLRSFAESALSGKRVRSLPLGLLTLGFRKKPGKVVVTDEEKALNLLRVTCPDAIKTTEKVLVSKLSEQVKGSAMVGELSGQGFDWEPATDMFKID